MSQRTTCVTIGGGPAGMVTGLLLARAGVQVTVLEKHADFLRDFRGDTVHPSTLVLLDDLGLGERFAQLPQSRLERVAFFDENGHGVTIASFDRLKIAHPYIAMVPQWDLLSLLAEAGEKEPTFTLRMSTEVTGLLQESGRVVGVRHDGPDGPGKIHSDLTIACDGRESLARTESGLVPHEFPVNFDAWWFRLSGTSREELALTPRGGWGRFAVVIPREGYLQIAYLARKGTDSQLRARGIAAFRADVAELIPEVADRTASLHSMDEVKHLDVRLNRLRRWHLRGLLCIGDAAHAMSPIGGVGINLAVQDAVAAADLLARPLREGTVTTGDLARVRRRRLLPTVVVQLLQRAMQRVVTDPLIEGERSAPPARLLKILERFPALTRVPAFLIGVGVRPERAPRFARRPGARA